MQERPYWLDIAPRPDDLAGASLPQRTDVVVIGGGYTGLSAAYSLARGGAAVTVIDRGPLGGGASTRNAGFVLPGFRRDTRSLLDQLGAVRTRELFHASRGAVLRLQQLATGERPELPCDYRPCGHLVLAAKPAHYEELERDAEVLAKALRHHTELVPRERLGEELGASVPYFGGRVDPLAASLNPAKLYWSLATAAQRAGAALVEDVEVQSLRRNAGRFMVRTSRGTLGGRDVVVATGGYGHPVHPSLRRRIVPVSGALIVTAPLGQNVARALIRRDRVVSDTSRNLTWFRILGDTRMVFGGGDEFRRTTTYEQIRNLTDVMCAHFPRLRGTDVDYHWTGLVAMTLDQLPHAGVRDGVHYALGCNGYGVALATYLGDRLAETIMGRADLEPFRSLRFRPVPVYFRKPFLLPLLGMYYRMRDTMR